ncbi:cytochrome AA3 biosynthesis protein [Halobacteriales archaeon SW_10_66_29]|nr:MAG: cytochrome AA3 biosynthesis protein [Halobacteriales archaeon QH_7_66_37]PSQ35070.1 MAG: cytochrome AA3 biosynthesis protein [Halobacteriales archaeon SW_10_66_29]
MRLSFRHYLAVTTASTLGLILLGVYTGKVGAGLACEGRWPFCDGWLGLFPATWPSFVEWFHRLVAMVVGFMILGAGAVAWRGEYDRYIRYALTLTIVMLPVQIIFGANTVLNFGLWASMAHQIAAQIIFGSLVFATTVAFWSAKSRPETQPSRSPTPSNADD